MAIREIKQLTIGLVLLWTRKEDNSKKSLCSPFQGIILSASNNNLRN